MLNFTLILYFFRLWLPTEDNKKLVAIVNELLKHLHHGCSCKEDSVTQPCHAPAPGVSLHGTPHRRID